MNTLASVFDWLLATSLRATVLAVGVLILQRLLRRHLSPRWRHALWLPVLVVLLTPVFPESPWSFGSTWQAMRKQPAQVLLQAPRQENTLPLAPHLTGSLPGNEEAAISAPVSWHSLAALAWAFGAALFLAGGLISFSRVLWRFKAARLPVNDQLQCLIEKTAQAVGLRSAPQVWVSAAVSSPAVAGLLRPVLLLPAQFEHAFTAAEARLILRHELTHLKRHDLPVNALMGVLMALHWFNPVLWLAFFKARADREIACDAQVLEDATPASRVEYGHALLKVESACSPLCFSLGFVGMFQRGGALHARIRSIAVQRRTTPLSALLASLCVLLMTFFGITRAQTADPAASAAPLVSLEMKVIEIPAGEALKLEGLPQAKMLPGLAIVPQGELSKHLQPLLAKPGATIIISPRVLTRSGHEVDIKTVVDQPPKNAHGTAPADPIGLVWKADPAVLEGAKIRLKTNIHHAEFLNSPAAPVSGEVPPLRTFDHQTTVELEPGFSAAIISPQNDKAGAQRTRLYIITPTLVAAEKDASAPAGPGQAGASGPPDPALARREATPSPPATKTIRTTTSTRTVTQSTDAETSATTAKLETIVIPTVSFKEATLAEAVNFMRAESRELAGAAADTAIKFLLLQDDASAGAKITLDLRDVPLSEMLRYVTELAGVRYRVIPGAVIIGSEADFAAQALTTLKSGAGTLVRDAHGSVSTANGQRPAVNGGTLTLATPQPPGLDVILPEVRLRDSRFEEAIDFIRAKSRELDPAKKGVNILVRAGGPADTRITLDLKNVPLLEALKYIAELGHYDLKVEAYGITLQPQKQ